MNIAWPAAGFVTAQECDAKNDAILHYSWDNKKTSSFLMRPFIN